MADTRFSKLMAWLALHLWVHVVLYSIVILGFAAAYSAVPDQFYSSTTQFEPATGELRDSIESRLGTAIRRNVGPAIDGLPSIRTWRFNGTNVWDLQLNGRWLTARAYVIATSLTAAAADRVSATFDIRISAADGLESPELIAGRDRQGAVEVRENDHPTFTREAIPSNLVARRAMGTGLPFDWDELFPCRSLPTVHPLCIEVDKSLEEDLQSLTHLLAGRPAASQRDFRRMVYLSVVTITTLGFGDVVPITPHARDLVTAEAFLGPILLGLFLAAVGERMKPRST